jgi:integrase
MERAGIDVGRRWLVSHSLRHTYNTRMRNVLPETLLQYMIGHRSRTMTERYDQALPAETLGELMLVQEQIDGVWK